MTKLLILAVGVIVISATAARAEAWACTFILLSSKEPVSRLFRLAPPYDLVDTTYDDHYRVLQSNELALIATRTISRIEKGEQKPTITASTVVIDKSTGEFWWDSLTTGLSADEAALWNKPVQGKCVKD
jgi:hypothetical protein